jgi:hypothetical protein
VNRRLFLRSAAAAIALPALPSLLPRTARADLSAPRRLLFVYVPNGIPLTNFRPTQLGADYDLPPLLASLAPVADRTLVLSGLANPAAIDETNNGDHARGTGSFLTCTPIRYTAGVDLQNGVSVDQVAAAALGGDTPLPSLQLGLEPGGNTGSCNAGYSCAYTRNLAWADPATPLPNLTDLNVAFQRVFPQADAGLPPEVAARRAAMRVSILDTVTAQAGQLAARANAEDRAKLDQYLTAVRDLELRLQALGGQACGGPLSIPADADLTGQARAAADLIALAVQCDQTRFITYMLGNSGSNRSFDFLGVPGSHHELSHHQGDPVKLAQLDTIATWEIAQLGYLVEALANTVDLDGASVLDHSAVFFSSEIQDGNDHTHTDLPVLLSGGLGGVLRTGAHLQVRPGARVSECFLTLLQAIDPTQTTFGDSQRPLTEILA